MLDELKKLAPPGINLVSELGMYLVGAVAAFLYSLMFFIPFNDALSSLYYEGPDGRILNTELTMPDFSELLENSMNGFFFLALCSLIFIIYHYFYFSGNGSRALYTMKRLPQRTLLAKYCLTVPILMAVTALLAAFVLLLLYFGIYMLVTPDECIRAGQWAGIWRF